MINPWIYSERAFGTHDKKAKLKISAKNLFAKVQGAFSMPTFAPVVA